jgi:predicted phosphodiesterase
MTQIVPDKIAVISDIHGNRWALEAVLEDIRQRGIETILNLGDSLYGPLDPAGTFDLICAQNIISVRGNEDRIITEKSSSGVPSATLEYVRRCVGRSALNWLKALPATQIRWDDTCMVHGTADRDDEYLLHEVTETGICKRGTDSIVELVPDVPQSLILCGHDHLPGSRELPDGRVIVNPGSVGLQAYDDDTPWPHAVATGSPHARFAVLTKVEANWSVEHVKMVYDWETAADMAVQFTVTYCLLWRCQFGTHFENTSLRNVDISIHVRKK